MAKSTMLGPLESRLLGWSQMVDRTRVRTREVAETLRIAPVRASELLDRMARDGTAIQLQRGLYLLPEKLPPGGRWQPPVAVALWHYFDAKNAKWQETGPAAFNHYGLSEQLANVTYVYNDRVSGIRRFGRLQVNLIKVKPGRLGHTVALRVTRNRSERRRIGTLPRVVLDAVYDYTRFGTLPKAYDWISQRQDDEDFLSELVQCSRKYGNLATARRIGWQLDRLNVAEATWRPLLRVIPKTSAYTPLDPHRPARGPRNKRWGIVENLEKKG